MRSAILLSTALTFAIAGAASAQTSQEDDRFAPRIYGSLATTAPDYGNVEVEIFEPTPATTVTRVVEPVQPTVSSIITAPVTYSEQSAVQAEADRVRTYQETAASQPTTSEAYTGAYEIQLYEPSNTLPDTVISSSEESHEVAQGDTLYNISKRYGTTVAAIQDANGLSGTNISLGQSLRIPASAIPAQSLNSTMAQPIFASAPVQEGYVTRRVVQPVSSYNSGAVYAVLPKDTLYSISRRTCTSVGDLISTNSLSDPNAISPGQKLTLPSGHCLTN